MALRKTIVHGTTVYFEDNAKAGVEHLAYDLQFEEAAVFFAMPDLVARLNLKMIRSVNLL